MFGFTESGVDNDWTFDDIRHYSDEIEKIAVEWGIDFYPMQIEMISAEQMIAAYSTVAMPVMYNHWSFGKDYIQTEQSYKSGEQGLAYEVVINTNPCLVYLMENNTKMMQALVIAHAGIGHSSFFKTNYMFKTWTDAESILTYLKFAKKYVQSCEEKYGQKETAMVLSAAHAIKNFGVDKYKRRRDKSEEQQAQVRALWEQYKNESYNAVNDKVGKRLKKKEVVDDSVKSHMQTEADKLLPEENILYFIEKYSPMLEPWERELIRIVRKVAQYFYPQMQTQVMNEGFACFCHYEIMTELHKRGVLTDGQFLEFLESHTAVTAQYNTDRINPYALGYAMMSDIKRICTEPDEEDRKLFPDIVDTDYWATIKSIVANYRDESFILQFLSPKVVSKFKYCALNTNEFDEKWTVTGVEEDLDIVRQKLSKQYNLSNRLPQIYVEAVDWFNTRELHLRYVPTEDKKELHDEMLCKTLQYIDLLWGYEVRMRGCR